MAREIVNRTKKSGVLYTWIYNIIYIFVGTKTIRAEESQRKKGGKKKYFA